MQQAQRPLETDTREARTFLYLVLWRRIFTSPIRIFGRREEGYESFQGFLQIP